MFRARRRSPGEREMCSAGLRRANSSCGWSTSIRWRRPHRRTGILKAGLTRERSFCGFEGDRRGTANCSITVAALKRRGVERYNRPVMNGKYYRENEWWVSPYNYAPEVRAQFQLPEK